MSKIFAEVFVPSHGITFDAILPLHITVSQAIMLISKTISEKEATYNSSVSEISGESLKTSELHEPLALYSIDTGEMLKEYETIEQCRIQDACSLAIL